MCKANYLYLCYIHAYPHQLRIQQNIKLNLFKFLFHIKFYLKLISMLNLLVLICCQIVLKYFEILHLNS